MALLEDDMIAMFGLGAGELVIIALVVLLLFGATRLPSLLGGLGKGLREFKEGFKGEEGDAPQQPPVAQAQPAPAPAPAVGPDQLRPAVGKQVRLLPDGTLEVGGMEGATMVEVDGANLTVQDDSNVNRIPLGQVKRIVHIS